ncbi:hypothetical protein [Microseira wollei]|nr:hypothetical protein [Microseira wollei]
MKVTTQLRNEYQDFGNINADVWQRNIAKLDIAFSNFWKQGRGLTRYLRQLNAFEYKPGQVKIGSLKDSYAIIYLPGIGNVKMFNSRDLTQIRGVRTCTVKRGGGYWFISMLVDLPVELPSLKSEVKSVVGIDVGVNKLVAVSDGSFIENIRPTTNNRTAGRLAIRQRAISPWRQRL